MKLYEQLDWYANIAYRRWAKSVALEGKSMGMVSYRKRAFLTSVSSGITSYIYAEAESSNGGEYKYGHYMIILADCHRKIELEFFLGTLQHRRQSLAKIDLLIEVLTAFRAALRNEAELITKWGNKRTRLEIRKKG